MLQIKSEDVLQLDKETPMLFVLVPTSMSTSGTLDLVLESYVSVELIRSTLGDEAATRCRAAARARYREKTHV